MPWRRCVAALVPLLMLLSACGGDDDSALSKDEYIAAADDLCRDFMEESDAFPQPQTPEELADLLAMAISLGDRTSAAFADLEPPPEGEDVHQALRTSLDDSLVKMRDAQRALRSGDIPAVQAAVEAAVDIGDNSDEQAKAFGFAVCGSEKELRAE